MTLEEITSFCEIRDCSVELGDPRIGFIQVDGGGIVRNRYTYGRFMLLNEVSALAPVQQVVEAATQFRIRRNGSEELLDRPAFEEKLRRLRRLTGV